MNRELPRRCELGALRARLAELEHAQHLPARHSDRPSTAGAGGSATARAGTIATGFPELDERLGGGWRVGALNELLIAPELPDSADRRDPRCGAGSGALEAFLPTFARLQARWLAWIDVPHPRSWAGARLQRLLYPPALAQAGFDLSRLLLVRPGDAREQAWALDLALRSGACDAVISRLDGAAIWSEELALRRLQLAAEEGGALGFLVRPAAFARTPSAAAVRLQAAPLPSPDPRCRRLRVTVLRCRGGQQRTALPDQPLELEWSRDPLVEPATAAPATTRTAVATARLHLALGA